MSHWYNIKIRRAGNTVFRGKAKSWTGLVKKIGMKDPSSFNRVVKQRFEDEWIRLVLGKNKEDLDKEDVKILIEYLERLANEISKRK